MKLQVSATEEAIASTATSLKNSPFEGNKFLGGSINREEGGGGGGGLLRWVLTTDFVRFFGAVDILRLGFLAFRGLLKKLRRIATENARERKRKLFAATNQ